MDRGVLPGAHRRSIPCDAAAADRTEIAATDSFDRCGPRRDGKFERRRIVAWAHAGRSRVPCKAEKEPWRTAAWARRKTWRRCFRNAKTAAARTYRNSRERSGQKAQSAAHRRLEDFRGVRVARRKRRAHPRTAGDGARAAAVAAAAEDRKGDARADRAHVARRIAGKLGGAGRSGGRSV